MYHTLKNSLLALTVAAGIVGFGYALGEPTPPLAADLAAVSAPISVTATAAAQPTAAASTPAAARRSQGLKRHLAMPFISFSPLLSRRGA